MRNDERYRPKPQSGQLEIFGLGAKGEADAEDARRWIDENPGAWNYMVENAVRLSKKGYVSANYLVNMSATSCTWACATASRRHSPESWRRATPASRTPSTSIAASPTGSRHELGQAARSAP